MYARTRAAGQNNLPIKKGGSYYFLIEEVIWNKLIKEGCIQISMLQPCGQNFNSAYKEGVPVCNFNFDKN
jgi:hypothetical protein